MTLVANRESQIQNELLNYNTLLTQYELENSELKIMDKNFNSQNKEYKELKQTIKNVPAKEKINKESIENFKKRFEAYVIKKCDTSFVN
jgi:hypothetical protein